jgi:hypothetical protein
VSGLPTLGHDVQGGIMLPVLRWEYRIFGGRWDKDGALWVRALTNKEPLEVVKAGINIVWEVVGQDVLDSLNGMSRESEPALHSDCRGS